MMLRERERETKGENEETKQIEREQQMGIQNLTMQGQELIDTREEDKQSHR